MIKKIIYVQIFAKHIGGNNNLVSLNSSGYSNKEKTPLNTVTNRNNSTNNTNNSNNCITETAPTIATETIVSTTETAPTITTKTIISKTETVVSKTETAPTITTRTIILTTTNQQKY
ncbi:hypothetical protein ACTA71_010707 [Dictyostelium dimigraforme]